jgi:hypothetical protein
MLSFIPDAEKPVNDKRYSAEEYKKEYPDDFLGLIDCLA